MYVDASAVFVCVNTGFAAAVIAGVEVVPPPQNPLHAGVVGLTVTLFVALPIAITVPLTV
jgi:hypothetical protein